MSEDPMSEERKVTKPDGPMNWTVDWSVMEDGDD